jgi:SpoIID/LytB domain protein
VSARTFAMANPGRHRSEGFDLCDLTHCQVARVPTAASRAAAAATSGQILMFEGAPAQVFFSAACGGRSEDMSALWPDPGRPAGYPYLAARDDEFCANDKRPWTAEIDANRIGRALQTAGHRGTIRGLRIARRNRSGRVDTLRIDGMTPPEISGQDFRMAVGRVLGWQLIKSTSFDLRRSARGYRFDGVGSGHGVGLCLAGSSARAAAGRTTAQILDAYYPGLRLGVATAAAPAVVAPSGTTLLLAFSAAEEGEREGVEAEVRDALDSLRRRIGVPAPAQVRLQFHPTPEGYQRSTGRAWWTAAATRGQIIELQPVALLRARGILPQTLRHEIAHVLTGPALEGRPLWVREGAAIHFAGESRPAPGKAPRCPSDDELLRAPSAVTFRDAYYRAGVCFERQLARGADWRSVR